MTPFDVLAQAVTAHATRSAKKLRQHGLVARTLTVFFHTNSRIAAIGFTEIWYLLWCLRRRYRHADDHE